MEVGGSDKNRASEKIRLTEAFERNLDNLLMTFTYNHKITLEIVIVI